MGELFANGSNHLYIEPYADIMGEHRDILSWQLCIWTYLHAFVLILCSLLCFMCSTGRLTVKCLEIRELWYVAYMLAYASVLYLTICQITWSLWLGTRGLTKLGLKFMG